MSKTGKMKSKTGKALTLRDIAHAAHAEGRSLRIRTVPTFEEAVKQFKKAVYLIGTVEARRLLDSFEDNVLNAPDTKETGR